MFWGAEIENLAIGKVKWSVGRKSKWRKNQKWKRKWSFGTLYESELSWKNVLDSWDRGLFVGDLKRSLRDKKITKRNILIFDFETAMTSYYWPRKFWWFIVAEGSESSIPSAQIFFCSNFDQNLFPGVVAIFKFVQKFEILFLIFCVFQFRSNFIVFAAISHIFDHFRCFL